MPFFSIIIPVYNRVDFIAKTIYDALDQTFQDFEIIIIDDGSEDATEREIQKISDKRVRYFKTKNRERSHARNYGLKQAKGKYINYFDSDDMMYPNRLQTVYNFIESNSEPDVLYTHYDFINEKGEKIGRMNRHYESFTKDILYNNFLATDAVFLKKGVATQFPFDENRQIITAEDWELWLRMHTTHNFKECAISTFAMMQHDERSLNSISASRIEERDLYFSKMIRKNRALEEKYGESAIRLFMADRYTFIALSMCENGDYLKAIHYWTKSLITSFYVIRRKRFWAVIKKICLR
jgi:glycosyltransferase involved in cell wall biosynthesis